MDVKRGVVIRVRMMLMMLPNTIVIDVAELLLLHSRPHVTDILIRYSSEYLKSLLGKDSTSIPLYLCHTKRFLSPMFSVRVKTPAWRSMREEDWILKWFVMARKEVNECRLGVVLMPDDD
jgi:hypothetical protein